jgi:ketopantoate reductase
LAYVTDEGYHPSTYKVPTLQDLKQDKRLESGAISGYAVRQAAELGFVIPTMDTCYKLIAVINPYM